MRADVQSTELPGTIMLAKFPQPEEVAPLIDDEAEAQMEVLLGIVKAGRSLRKTAADVLGKSRAPDHLRVVVSETDVGTVSDARSLVEGYCDDLRLQTGAGAVSVVDTPPAGSLEMHAAAGVSGTVCALLSVGCRLIFIVRAVYCAVAGDPEGKQKLTAEVKRLQGRRKKLAKTMGQLRARLSDPKFLANVPPHVRNAVLVLPECHTHDSVWGATRC